MIQLEEKLYTSTEVADILGVGLRSVYRYLEEGKIDAEVKTATGRHRFSKKNILDFLYPDGKGMDTETIVKEASKKPDIDLSAKKKQKIVEPTPKKIEVIEEEVVAREEPQVVQTDAEEPIDWLAKFREAAKKYREESEQPEPQPAAKQPARQATEDVMSMADAVKVSSKPAFEEDVKPAKVPTEAQNYYRSSLGGLKDIAQNIDKGSRNSYLDYAFTLNAGLSLYKPIKPFSVLHAYVRPSDLPFFEKLLGLSPADESNAQLGLIMSDNDDIYKKRQEMHGLYVVDKKKLYDDVQKWGDSTLAGEASEILR